MLNLISNAIGLVGPGLKIAKAASDLFTDNKKETFDEKVTRINEDTGKYAGLSIDQTDGEVIIKCHYKQLRLEVTWTRN